MTVDSYSGCFELNTLNTGTSSKIVLQKLKPHFSSSEFKQFSNEWGFVHKTSNPGFPQSNGLIERAAQTVKRMLDKCKCDGTDPYVALFKPDD